jgi:hypothetical protein
MGDYELTIIKGTDLPYTITFKDDDGEAIDITDWTINFMVKEDINDDDAKITKSVTSHTNPTQGITTLTIDRADTSGLSTGNYIYNFQVIKSDGKYKHSVVDNFIIKPSVVTGD